MIAASGYRLWDLSFVDPFWGDGNGDEEDCSCSTNLTRHEIWNTRPGSKRNRCVHQWVAFHSWPHVTSGEDPSDTFIFSFSPQRTKNVVKSLSYSKVSFQSLATMETRLKDNNLKLGQWTMTAPRTTMGQRIETTSQSLRWILILLSTLYLPLLSLANTLDAEFVLYDPRLASSVHDDVG